jgi:hypothetical protein
VTIHSALYASTPSVFVLCSALHERDHQIKFLTRRLETFTATAIAIPTNSPASTPSRQSRAEAALPILSATATATTNAADEDRDAIGRQGVGQEREEVRTPKAETRKSSAKHGGQAGSGEDAKAQRQGGDTTSQKPRQTDKAGASSGLRQKQREVSEGSLLLRLHMYCSPDYVLSA